MARFQKLIKKKSISHPTFAQHTISAAETVHVSHALPAFSSHAYCGAVGVSIQDGVEAEGFLCAPY
jgi:hypothetical protein